MSRLIRYALFATIAAAGCQMTASQNGEGGGARFYAGAGSEWTAQVNPDQTIMLIHFPALGDPSADQLVNAGVTLQSSGLTALTVTSSAGSTAPAEGASGRALEVPGTMLALAPFAGGPLIPLVSAGDCPPAAQAANLVKVKSANGWTAAAGDAAATFAYDLQSGVASLPARYTVGDPADAIAGGELSLGAASCTAGIVTPSGGAEMFLSAGGAVIVHTAPAAEAQAGDEIYFGLPQASAPVMPVDLAGDWVGLLYAADGATTNAAVQLALAADGSAAGTGVGGSTVAVDGAALDATITLDGPGAADGILVGTVTTAAGAAAQPLVCAAQPVARGAPPMLACAGATASGGLLSLILAGD